MFAEEDALARLEAFASLNGPAHYGLPVNDETLTLARGPLAVPDRIEGHGQTVTLFDPGHPVHWHVEDAP